MLELTLFLAGSEWFSFGCRGAFSPPFRSRKPRYLATSSKWHKIDCDEISNFYGDHFQVRSILRSPKVKFLSHPIFPRRPAPPAADPGRRVAGGQCVPIQGRGFWTGGYKCDCKQGYEYPFEDPITYFDGQLVESEFLNLVRDEPTR